MLSPAVAWATALLLAGLSTATPVITFPINSQVPPVARLGQPFSFVFSPSTFSSSLPITYSLANAPKWLSIDSDSRRLFGTPGPDDVAPGPAAGVSLNLVASDDSGSTTVVATLVVSRHPGPSVEIPLEKQIPEFGAFSSPSTILSTPGKGFSIRLDQKTFSSPSGAPISYYATAADNTPLPAWISFDPANLSFSGQTPPAESLVQPPQRFSFHLIASDVVGFAGASLAFDIVVGSHLLVADEPVIVLNATRGTLLSYTGLGDTVKTDGKPAAPGALILASAPNIPPWLSIDKHTWHMAGVPPTTAESTNFTITLHDTFSNSLNLTVLIEFSGDEAHLFTGNTPKFVIFPGKPFSLDLGPYLLEPRDTEVSIETDSLYSWIQLDSSTTTLFGEAPGNLEESSINVKITAKSSRPEETAFLSFNIAIRSVSGGKEPTATNSTAAGAHPTESPGGQLSLAGDSLRNGRFNPVLLAVLLPLLLLLGLAICALFWFFRRRQDRRKPPFSTRDISGPLPGTFVAKASGPGVSHSLPDFTKRFCKGSLSEDVFGLDKKDDLESGNVSLARPEPPQPVGDVRLLPPGTGRSSDSSVSQDDDRSMLAVAPGSSMILRPGARGKISSSLSSITETSTIGELADPRGLEAVGNDNRRSFRDRVEINVPRLLQTPGSMYPASPSPTEATSTPRPGSAWTIQETDAVSLRSDSRLSYFPPGLAARKRSWGWLKGVKGKRQGPKVILGMKRVSEQPSVLTVDTLASEKTGQQSLIIPGTVGNVENEAADLDSSPTAPLPQFPSRASLSRPPTRSGPATSGSLHGSLGRGPPPTKNPATPVSGLPPTITKENSTPGFPIRGETPADSLDIYDGIIEHNPFRPSETWSTLPTTDEWVDETVESLALSRSTSQRQQNWTVLQDSPLVRSGDATASPGVPDVASSVWLPQVREGRGELGPGEESLVGVSSPILSRPGTAVTAGGRENENWERSGLARKSQSKGVSLRSEGSKSDYAVFI